MYKAITIIGILSLVLFVLITIVRIVAIIFLKYTIRKYKQLLALIKPKENDNYVPSGTDEVLYRDKDLEIKKIEEKKLQNVIRLNEEKVNEKKILENKKRIVGMVKPIGYWTSLIMGQRVSYLMQQVEILKEQNDNGYWVNMMHAKDKSKGKSRGI